MPGESLREIGHYEIELEPIAVPDGNNLDLPYTDKRYFEVTGMPLEKEHIIPEGTVGNWRTYLPNEAIFLTDRLQKESAILMISFGRAPDVTELAFVVETFQAIDDLAIIRSGLAMFLNKDCPVESEETETIKRYKDEETAVLLNHAHSRHSANQHAGQRDLDYALSMILKQPSHQQ